VSRVDYPDVHYVCLIVYMRYAHNPPPPTPPYPGPPVPTSLPPLSLSPTLSLSLSLPLSYPPPPLFPPSRPFSLSFHLGPRGRCGPNTCALCMRCPVRVPGGREGGREGGGEGSEVRWGGGGSIRKAKYTRKCVTRYLVLYRFDTIYIYIYINGFVHT
jgi:hypothetical protein